MRSMEFSGRSVDEAIFNGLSQMGVTIDEVDIETVQSETKGLFGIGAKQAVVRLTERAEPLSMEFEKVLAREKENQQRAPRPRGPRRDERPQRPRRDERPQRSSFDRDSRGGWNEGRDQTPAVQYDYSLELAKEIPAAQFLTELLQKMNLPCQLEAANTDDGLRLNIAADTNGLLIGRRGETLDALQYIVSLYANKSRKDEGYQRITLDTEGYRARREETLRRLARRTAAQVRSSGRSVAMEPMNPYERRVLHSALTDYAGVVTHSEGEEPNRRVVIVPSAQQEQE